MPPPVLGPGPRPACLPPCAPALPRPRSPRRPATRAALWCRAVMPRSGDPMVPRPGTCRALVPAFLSPPPRCARCLPPGGHADHSRGGRAGGRAPCCRCCPLACPRELGYRRGRRREPRARPGRIVVVVDLWLGDLGVSSFSGPIGSLKLWLGEARPGFTNFGCGVDPVKWQKRGRASGNFDWMIWCWLASLGVMRE
jgi:hypothetical protein